eukprot:TRINITY_DN4370_c0_g3_i2.p1 TRINITY_DN4370_c0_g3~~TRINITY_DN4370_c0_g3_i2.p1  ORF type:complete len:572 (+),score=25.28 TRINITY_DN4370_c0_g3_i2:47-1762(+)
MSSARRVRYVQFAVGLLFVTAVVLRLNSPNGQQSTIEHLSRNPSNSSQELIIHAPEILQWERLLQYNRSDLLAASISEDILLTLERDVQRLLVMREMAPQRFKRIYPHDYTQRRFTEKVGLAAFAGAMTAGGVADRFMSLGRIYKVSRMLASTGVGYGKFIEWLTTYVINMKEATRKMVMNGGDSGSLCWKDVTLGTVYDAYHSAFLAHNTYLNVAPTIIEMTPMRTSGCGASNEISHALLPGDICSQPKQLNQPNRRRRKILTDGSHACVECSVNGRTGWINASSVVPYGWYKFSESSGSAGASVPIYKEFGSKHPSTDLLYFGEAFTIVERRHKAFRLGDGRGWIRLTQKLSASLKGPLIQDEARSERKRQITRLMKPKPRHTSSIPRGISEVSQKYNSPPSVVGRFVVKTGFFVGGFFTQGALWIPATLFGMGDAAFGMGLTMATQGRALDKVSFLMIALARLENRVFSKRSNALPCDMVTQLCPQGKVCWRHGIFHRVARSRTSQSREGFCIRPPWPVLPDFSPCVVDLDCASSYCKFKEYDEKVAGSRFGRKILIDALRGYCAPTF